MVHRQREPRHTAFLHRLRDAMDGVDVPERQAAAALRACDTGPCRFGFIGFTGLNAMPR